MTCPLWGPVPFGDEPVSAIPFDRRCPGLRGWVRLGPRQSEIADVECTAAHRMSVKPPPCSQDLRSSPRRRWSGMPGSVSPPGHRGGATAPRQGRARVAAELKPPSRHTRPHALPLSSIRHATVPPRGTAGISPRRRIAADRASPRLGAKRDWRADDARGGLYAWRVAVRLHTADIPVVLGGTHQLHLRRDDAHDAALSRAPRGFTPQTCASASHQWTFPGCARR